MLGALLEASLWASVGLAGLGVAQAWANACTFAPLPPLAPGQAEALAQAESLWILVPARNEAARIGPLLASFQALKGDRLRLLVHDDASEDGTADLVLEAAAHDPRIALQRGQGPPPGWGGKVHALHRLAEEALEGGARWLLFVDADVRLLADAPWRAVAAAQADGLAVLSLYPQQILGTWGERLMLPLMLHQFFLLGPQWLDALGAPVIVRPLNGQFLLWRAEAYREVGGYAAVAGAWLDDMGMGRHLAGRPLRVRYRPGRGVAACRMYEGLAQLWAGFKKHHEAALGLPAWAFLGLQGALFWAWLWPFGALPMAWAFAWLPPERVGLWAVACLGLVLLSWGPSWWRTRQGGWAALAHPLSVALGLANGLASWWGGRRGALLWKGRKALGPGAA